MSRANIDLTQLNIQKISTTEFEKQIQSSIIQSSMNESDIATIKQQYESIYTSQDAEIKTDAVRTHDSRVPLKGSAQLKKKSVKKKIDKKMKLNLKQNSSNIKRTKKRVSRSNKRSKSKRKSPTVNDTLQSNISKKKSVQQIISFSPGKENDVLPMKSSTKGNSAQNISKISNNPNNTSKKIKSKTGIKMSKVKSSDKLLINKDKISRPLTRTKKGKDKSPVVQENLKYQTLEAAQVNDIISKNSPNNEVNNLLSEQQK